MTFQPNPLSERLNALQRNIAATPCALPKAHAPRLIAVSKGQPVAAIEAAISLGVRDFGENRVQEAYEKWPALLAAHPQLRLHLIGPLQTNKVKEAVALFHAIHTIDREKLADAVAAECVKQSRTLQCLIQVNTGEEPQKAGIIPQALDALVAHCRQIGLPISGLMCVPPAGIPPAPHFAFLYKNARAYAMDELSMGMSGDFETAIRFGATMIRVGTALFGERS